MSTHKNTWKQFESRVAAMFGCRRAILSGSSNRDDKGSSDTTHPSLFIEAKLREKHAVRTLFDKTARLAVKERKMPLLTLADKGRHGFLVVVHSCMLNEFIAEYVAGLDDDDRGEIEGEIRAAYCRRHGLDEGDTL